MVAQSTDHRRGQFSPVPTSSNQKAEISWGSRNRCAVACAIASIVIGVVLALAAVAGFYGLPEYYKSQVIQKSLLTPNSTTWQSWQNPPITVYYNYTFFVVQNPVDVAAGEKPVLREQGPYVYKEVKKREIIEAQSEEETIIFRQELSFIFDEEKSAPLKESDVVTVISPVTAGVSAKLAKQKKSMNYYVWAAIEEAINDYDDGLFVTKTVKEMLADGYESRALATIQEFAGKDAVPSTRFPGLMAKQSFGKNETYEGVYEIMNGVNDPEKLGWTVSYNGERELDYWHDNDDNACNKINGTDGAIFGPFSIKPDPEAKLYVFIPDMCRSLFLKFEADVEHHGIMTYRYTVPYEAVPDPRENPEAHCFCPEQFDPEECSIRGGVVPRNRCQPGSPVVMSTPHFYLTNFEEYYTDFEGLMPQKELHETYLDLDPIVSVPLSARKRIQVNMDVRPTSPLPSLQGLKKNYLFPLMWVGQGADFDETVAEMLKSKVYATKEMLSIAPWVLFGAGGIFILGPVIYLLKTRRS